MGLDYNADNYGEVVGLFSDEKLNKRKAKRLTPTATLKKSSSVAGENLLEKLSASIAAAKAAGRQVNPFLVGFTFDIKKSNGDKIESEKVFGEDGEEIETRHTILKTVDKGQFIKIYPAFISQLLDMSPAGKNLFAFILEDLKSNDGKDTVYLKHGHSTVIDKTGKRREIGRTSFYAGLKELIRLRIIAGCDDNLYFINPEMFFNGSRVSFATRFILTNPVGE